MTKFVGFIVVKYKMQEKEDSANLVLLSRFIILLSIITWFY